MTAKLCLFTHLCLILFDCTLVCSVDTLSTAILPSATDVHDTKNTSSRITDARVHSQELIATGPYVVKDSDGAEERVGPRVPPSLESKLENAVWTFISPYHPTPPSQKEMIATSFKCASLEKVMISDLLSNYLFRDWAESVYHSRQGSARFANELMFDHLLKLFGDSFKFAIHLVKAKLPVSKKFAFFLPAQKRLLLKHWELKNFDVNVFTGLGLKQDEIDTSDPVYQLWTDYYNFVAPCDPILLKGDPPVPSSLMSKVGNDVWKAIRPYQPMISQEESLASGFSYQKLDEVNKPDLLSNSKFHKWAEEAYELREGSAKFANELMFNHLLKFFGDSFEFAIHLLKGKYPSNKEFAFFLPAQKRLLLKHWESKNFDVNVFTGLGLKQDEIDTSDPVYKLWNEYYNFVAPYDPIVLKGNPPVPSSLVAKEDSAVWAVFSRDYDRHPPSQEYMLDTSFTRAHLREVKLSHLFSTSKFHEWAEFVYSTRAGSAKFANELMFNHLLKLFGNSYEFGIHLVKGNYPNSKEFAFFLPAQKELLRMHWKLKGYGSVEVFRSLGLWINPIDLSDPVYHLWYNFNESLPSLKRFNIRGKEKPNPKPSAPRSL